MQTKRWFSLLLIVFLMIGGTAAAAFAAPTANETEPNDTMA